MYACEWMGEDAVQSVELLIASGADVNRLDDGADDGRVALWYACFAGSLDLVRFLVIKCKADVNAQKYHTPLYIASEFGFVEIFDILRENGAKPDATFSRQSLGSPLHAACQEGHLEICQRLLEASVDINHEDELGRSAIFSAVERGPDVVRWCLSAGSEVDEPDNGGATPLFFAAQNGNAQVMRLLLDAGADPKRTTADGDTPLHAASKHEEVDAVFVLLEHGAQVDVVSGDGGMTALHNATLHACPRNVIKLLSAGANPSAVVCAPADAEGETPIHLAVLYGYIEIAELLIDAGADVFARNGQCTTQPARQLVLP